MYDISIQVTPKAIEPNKRITIEWPGYSGPTTVEWLFASRKDGNHQIVVQVLAPDNSVLSTNTTVVLLP